MLDHTSTYAIWLERMLKYQNMATSYKAFWLKGIVLDIIERQSQHLTFEQIIHRMIVEAWYPIVQFRLHFGVQDQLGTLVDYIETTYHLGAETHKNKLLSFLSEDERLRADKTYNKLVHNFTQMVPYRLLTPFFEDTVKGLKDQKKNRAIAKHSLESTEAFYRLDDKAQTLTVSSDWLAYILKNQAVILGWLKYKLATYIQRKNPSVPNILFKLDAPKLRELNQAKIYWSTAIRELALGDLYTGYAFSQPHTAARGQVSIDHFIPWSFVLHDELWNLLPTFKHINSAKSNKLPLMDRHLEAFCLLQYKSFNHMRNAPRQHKLMTDYLNLGGALNTREILDPKNHVDQDLFVNSLKSTLVPLHQIAANQGFELWREGGFYYDNPSSLVSLAAEKN